ncbi:MAG: hypothetical protein MUC87_03140 [Bacteroidia bacterium]|jgi:hypothetical protein|nr:hypothetical protein [Bacteroidia bacterium]
MLFNSLVNLLFKNGIKPTRSSSVLRSEGRLRPLRHEEDNLTDVVIIPDWLPEHLRPRPQNQASKSDSETNGDEA